MITLAILGVWAVPFLVVGGLLAIFLKPARGRILRRSAILYLGSALALVFGVGPCLMSWFLSHAGTRPQDRKLKVSPSDYGLRYEDVSFEARDSARLRGWFIPPSGRNVVIVSCHGLFRSRGEVLERTAALARLGYGTLLFDFRSHGESEKRPVTLGNAERLDVLGALDYVRQRYGRGPGMPRIVLMGVSMGAVAVLEAASEARGYAALVVDSPFSSIRRTVVEHAWLFLGLPRYPFPSLFLFWFHRMTGADVDRVDTSVALRHADGVPLLLMASDGDARIGADVARGLYRESTAPLKRLKVFGRDVPHGAASRLHPDEYNAAVADFLSSALP
jgi:uncharacterized protein